MFLKIFKNTMKNNIKCHQRSPMQASHYILVFIAIIVAVIVFIESNDVMLAALFIFMAMFILIMNKLGRYLSKKWLSKRKHSDDND